MQITLHYKKANLEAKYMNEPSENVFTFNHTLLLQLVLLILSSGESCCQVLHRNAVDKDSFQKWKC